MVQTKKFQFNEFVFDVSFLQFNTSNNKIYTLHLYYQHESNNKVFNISSWANNYYFNLIVDIIQLTSYVSQPSL